MPLSIDDFRRLWDGSEPGWRLNCIDHTCWTVTVCFAGLGPSTAEIAAIRKLVGELRDQPLSDLYERLRTRSSFTLPRELGNIDMRVTDAAQRLGLRTSTTLRDHSRYVPGSADGTQLYIEDAELAEKVSDRMIAAGAPVVEVHVD